MDATDDHGATEPELVLDVQHSVARARFSVRTALITLTTIALGVGGVVFAMQSGSERANLQGGSAGTMVQTTTWGTEIMSETTEASDATEASDTSAPDTTTVIVSETRAPFVTTPSSDNPLPTNVSCEWTTEVLMSGTVPPGCPPPPSYQPQDIYRDICVPLDWTNCAEYRIYDQFGTEMNHVISNSDWSLAYTAELGGGGENGYAVKVREIYPL